MFELGKGFKGLWFFVLDGKSTIGNYSFATCEIKMVRAIMIVEVAGRPAEHLKAALGEHIGVLNKVDDVTVHSIKLSEPRALARGDGQQVTGDSEIMLTCFAEADFECNSFARLSETMFDFMPSSVEVIEPSKVSLSATEATDLLNNISGRMHRYDEIAKIAGARLQQMNAQLQAAQKVLMERDNEISKLKKKSVKLAKEIIDELNTKSKEKRNYKIFKNDANEAIGDLIPEIQSSYVFAFIDPSGFQWNWTSMEQLLRLQRFDIIMNFQTREVNRLPKGKEETFFGPCAEKVCYCTNCDEKMMAYIKQIEEFGRFVTPIKIGMNQTNQYYYHLLHISPLDTYRSVITDLKSRIETFNGESIEEIWHDLLGNVRQTTFL